MQGRSVGGKGVISSVNLMLDIRCRNVISFLMSTVGVRGRAVSYVSSKCQR